ncbi:MAG TPA: asparagine synthase (glutamine-hydrolyzing) [Bryobacteraceae bacterium]|nr:asparagine synthase (glutamine-hydrolyzing) [Bryobacteraceae bacterium]
MCGIAGFTHARRPAAPGRIHDAVGSLIHRGPDQQGVFESPRASLGATRLRIVDLQGGDQPIEEASRGAAIAFNGEIYNHLELRRELKRRGWRFTSQTDTETVLRAFLEWDTDCFERLRGMFAVAIWIEPENRLILARDRMGIKPLYLAQHGGDVYFGSELKAILAHPEIGRALSLEGLDCYLSLNYVPGPGTLIEGIRKLPPGCWAEWRDGALRTERYWSLPLAGGQNGASVRKDRGEAQQELDGLLREAVAEQLVSDAPLGVWLSGGVDSSTLLHYAAQARGKLRTFSICFRGHSFDETSYIREVARHYGSEHHEADMADFEDMPGAIESFAYYSDEPNADAGAVPVWLLSRLTKRHATVALSGEGADELFGGYLTHRASLLARRARRLPRWSLKLAQGAISLLPVSDEKIGFEYMAKRFLAGCRMSFERAHVYWNGTFGAAEKRALVRRPLPGRLKAILSELAAAGDELGAYLWFDQKYFLPDDILAKVDRISMAHAVEVRPPFLDHRVVEFAAALPAEWRIETRAGRWRQKAILKDLMQKKLPARVLSRKKTGFDIPAHEWLRGPLRPLVEDAFAEAAGAYSGLFRFERIRAAAEAHFRRRANLGYHLWGLLTLFLWMKKWKIQTTPLPAPSGTAERVYLST